MHILKEHPLPYFVFVFLRKERWVANEKEEVDKPVQPHYIFFSPQDWRYLKGARPPTDTSLTLQTEARVRGPLRLFVSLHSGCKTATTKQLGAVACFSQTATKRESTLTFSKTSTHSGINWCLWNQASTRCYRQRHLNNMPQKRQNTAIHKQIEIRFVPA